ncbi:MAG TPA: ATP-dependent sacrificial sulfur transferase LarE [Mycobacteriales bacterium]|nr:ATP-dependent sacrificial sulfur transferase LarE [Mycobacteriales bacterium]
MDISPEIVGRLDRLDVELASHGSLLVAFSGGADSAFLLSRAATVLGVDAVVAATAVSASLPAVELDQAVSFAASLGVRHELPGTDEMSREGYRANGGDRCFHCKAELLDTLRPLADRLGIREVATGTNAADAAAGFRPGIRAAAERGAVTPLLTAGLAKSDVRAASLAAGLPTWDKPAAACLSSRVAYGIEITPSRLARVERAEAGIRAWLEAVGFVVRDLRVRDLGDVARLEVDAELVRELVRRRAEVEAVLRSVGFDRAEIDPTGFRSGSMNELLADAEAWR